MNDPSETRSTTTNPFEGIWFRDNSDDEILSLTSNGTGNLPLFRNCSEILSAKSSVRGILSPLNSSKEDFIDNTDDYMDKVMQFTGNREDARKALSDVLKGFSKEDIDSFRRSADDENLCKIRISSCNLLSSYANLKDYQESHIAEGIKEEENNIKKYEKDIQKRLKQIKDPEVRGSVAQAALIVAEDHGSFLGVCLEIINKIKAFFKNLFIVLGVGSIATVGGLAYLAASSIISPIIPIAVGISIVALFIYCNMRSKRRQPSMQVISIAF